MAKILAVLVLAAAGAGIMSCGPAPVVVEGSVVRYDKDSNNLVVKDERPPNLEISLSLAGAEIGAEPADGDTVRVAYHPESGGNRAVRVMNITRQAELRGGGGKH
jgi:hypothetical protein